MALCTIEEVRDYLGITGTNTTANEVIDRLCDTVTELFNTYCGRVLESTEHTEYYSCHGSDYLVLNNYPITSVSGIWDDIDRVWESTTEISSDDYLLDGNVLYLNDLYFSNYIKSVKVIYTAGYTEATLPADLKQAAIMEVVHLYKKASDGVSVSNRTTGEYNIAYNISNLQINTKLVLDLYRKVSLC